MARGEGLQVGLGSQRFFLSFCGINYGQRTGALSHHTQNPSVHFGHNALGRGEIWPKESCKAPASVGARAKPRYNRRQVDRSCGPPPQTLCAITTDRPRR
jgi:hypothetical protein